MEAKILRQIDQKLPFSQNPQIAGGFLSCARFIGMFGIHTSCMLFTCVFHFFPNTNILADHFLFNLRTLYTFFIKPNCFTLYFGIISHNLRTFVKNKNSSSFIFHKQIFIANQKTLVEIFKKKNYLQELKFRKDTLYSIVDFDVVFKFSFFQRNIDQKMVEKICNYCRPLIIFLTSLYGRYTLTSA